MEQNLRDGQLGGGGSSDPPGYGPGIYSTGVGSGGGGAGGMCPPLLRGGGAN